MGTLDNASRLQRFRFASFDRKDEKPSGAAVLSEHIAEPVVVQGPLPLPLELPAFNEKDIETARSEGHAAGHRDGYAAAQAKFDNEKTKREEAVHALLGIIANRITLAAEGHSRKMNDREALMGKLVIAAAKKIAGDALKKDPYSTVESLLGECVGLIAGKPKIKVLVSTALAPGLRQRIDTLIPLLKGFNGELKVEEAENLMDNDCRVEWGNGYAESNAQELWRGIEAVINKTNPNF